jgi:hypothetical protein
MSDPKDCGCRCHLPEVIALELRRDLHAGRQLAIETENARRALEFLHVVVDGVQAERERLFEERVRLSTNAARSRTRAA